MTIHTRVIAIKIYGLGTEQSNFHLGQYCEAVQSHTRSVRIGTRLRMISTIILMSLCALTAQVRPPQYPDNLALDRPSVLNLASLKHLNTAIDPKSNSEVAVNLAKKAYGLLIVGVGCILLDSRGRIWSTQHNKVLVDDCIDDPTAHGERQMNSWYLGQRASGRSIPPPSQMVIITSLDPSLMCTVALLEFAVISHDSHAGINWKRDQALKH